MASTKIWRLAQVLQQTGLSRSTIYEMISRGDFPTQVQLGRRAVGWIADDVVEWIYATRLPKTLLLSELLSTHI